MGNTHICLPFASEALYREYVDHPAQYRQYLSEMLHQYPELFPHDMDQGFPLHDADASVTQDVIVRRIKLHTTGAVFSLRPSCVMPDMIGRTDAVEQALSLRQWGVPFAALAYVFGRDAMFWYRGWLACGRPSLVGTTIKEPQTLPRDLVADEQLTRVAKPQVGVATPVGGGCFLGGSVVEAADTVTVERGDGACAKDSQGPGARLSGALGLHRRLGSNASGVAGPLSHDHAGAVLSSRDPEDEKALCGPIAPPGTRQGLAGIAGGDHTAVLRSACGAWPSGPRRTAVDRWPRWCCRGVAVGRTLLRLMSVRRPTAPPMPLIGDSTPKTGCSLPCAIGTVPPPVPAWPYGLWRCNGTFTRMVCACGVTSRRGCLRFTP